MSATEVANELIAGSVGGAAQVLVGQPLDTIKTRAQTASSSMSSSISRDFSLIPRTASCRGNVCECILGQCSETAYICRTEGSYGHSYANDSQGRFLCVV